MDMCIAKMMPQSSCRDDESSAEVAASSPGAREEAGRNLGSRHKPLKICNPGKFCLSDENGSYRATA